MIWYSYYLTLTIDFTKPYDDYRKTSAVCRIVTTCKTYYYVIKAKPFPSAKIHSLMQEHQQPCQYKNTPNSKTISKGYVRKHFLEKGEDMTNPNTHTISRYRRRRRQAFDKSFLGLKKYGTIRREYVFNLPT